MKVMLVFCCWKFITDWRSNLNVCHGSSCSLLVVEGDDDNDVGEVIRMMTVMVTSVSVTRYEEQER